MLREQQLLFTKYSESISPGTLLAGATFQLYQYAAGATTPGGGTLVSNEVYTTGADGKLSPKIENLTVGKYYLVETSVPVGYLISPNALDDANNLLHFEIKAGDCASYQIKFVNFEKPDVIKEATNGTGNSVNGPSYDVGSTVDYEATINIPTDIKGGKLLADQTITSLPYSVFYYADTPQAGLTYSGTSSNVDILTLSGGSLVSAGLVEGTDYTYIPTGTPGTAGAGFKIDFIMTNAAGTASVTDKTAAYAGKSLIIKYSMTINSSAVIDGLNKNEYELVYNNGAEDGSKQSDTSVTTGGAKFVKVDGSDSDIKLENAQFLIRKLNGAGDYVYYTKDTSGNVVWVATKAEAQGTQNSTTKLYEGPGVLTSSANGTFEVTGLAFGTYELEEIYAPVGYQLMTSTAEFSVNINSYADVAAVNSVTNNLKPMIPITGGTGTIFIITAGIAAMGFSVIVYKKIAKKIV